MSSGKPWCTMSLESRRLAFHRLSGLALLPHWQGRVAAGTALLLGDLPRKRSTCIPIRKSACWKAIRSMTAKRLRDSI